MMLKRWIVADQTKKPIPGTAAQDPAHWMSYDAAYQKLQDNPQAVHLGFSFFEGVERAGYCLVCIDLDSCFDPERKLKGWAQQIVDHYTSYTERSASGEGLHVFLWVGGENADYPSTKHYVDGKNGDALKQPQIQVIGGNKAGYVAITGDLYERVPDRITEHDSLNWLRGAYPPGGGREVDENKKVLEPSWKDDKPEFTAVAKQLDAMGEDVANLRIGKWTSIRDLDGTQHYESASEAYFALVHKVLKLFNRDGHRTLEFMLSEFTGTWGAGTVECSVESAKYGIEDWVANRVKKATAVTHEERPNFVIEKVLSDLFGEAEEVEEDDLGFLQPGPFRIKFGGAITFMVNGLVPATGVVQFYGKPKHGKSQVILSLITAVASGAETCWGQRVFIHGPVLVLVGEDHHGVAKRTLAQELVSEVGLGAGQPDLPIYLTVRPGNVTDAAGIARLNAQCEAIRPVMIVLDTQIANAGNLDENDTQAMSGLMKLAEGFSFKFNCLVALVHHTAKSGRGGARGSSVQAGAVSADFECIISGKGFVRLIPRNAKNWQARDEMRLAIETREVGFDPDGEPEHSPAIDFRVDPSAAESLPVDDPKPPAEVGTATGDAPEIALVMFTIENGRALRAEVAKHMHELGYLSTGTTDALRYLEKKLVEAGKLTVDSSKVRGDSGVVYGAQSDR
jgi:hypothetical protein